MSKYDRNGVKHDGWADVGRANWYSDDFDD